MKELKNGVLILIILVIFSVFLLYTNPSITGLIVYDYQENTQIWDLSNLNYNPEEIEFSNNLRLKLQIEDNSYTETIENTATIISAIKNDEDQTDKVKEIDNKKVTINENHIFNINFDNELNNDDIINLNLEEDEEVTISLCNQEDSTECYTSINYPGEEGDYTITIQNLENPTSSFNLKVDNKIKFNYISATYYTEEFHNIINSSYPESASATTDDLEISNLDYYGILTKDETLNEQTIYYFYSTDSGNNWNQIENFNLSSITENPIKFKIILNSDTISTPILNSLSLKYFTKSCTENWECTEWNSCTLESTQSRTCTDLNECSNSKIEVQNCTYINYSTSYQIVNTEIVNIKQNTITEIITDETKLEILLDNNVTNNNISIINYNSSNKTLSGKIPAKRFVDIEVGNEIKNTLKNYILKIYYTDEEIQGINEDSLKIHYYNKLTKEWEILESYVNTTGNYVWANLTHFSTYGIFGDEISQSIASSSGSSSGGSSKSKTIESIIIPQVEEPKEEIQETKEEIKEFEEITVPSEQKEETFQNFITGQATLIKNKLTEFAKKNLYILLIILSLVLIYIIFRSINFFKVKDEKKLIIFDFDGVLADTFNEVYDGYKYLSKKYNFKPLENKDDLRDLYKENIFKSLKRFKCNLRNIKNIEKDFEERANQRIEYVKTFPGIKSLIPKLKKYNLAIVSSNKEYIIKKFLKKNDIDYFNLILDFKTKSKKRKLRKAIKHFKVRIKEALFITDTIGDVKEAKKVGVETIAVTWGYHKKEDFKDLKVKTVDNPTEILRNI